MKIHPIEEAFYVVAKFKIPTMGEEIEEADSLAYLYQKLQETANEMSAKVYDLYPALQKQLIVDIGVFQKDCETFCSNYAVDGPMKPSLSPKEASDTLAYFQVGF